jgi:hypothetical protein
VGGGGAGFVGQGVFVGLCMPKHRTRRRDARRASGRVAWSEAGARPEPSGQGGSRGEWCNCYRDVEIVLGGQQGAGDGDGSRANVQLTVEPAVCLRTGTVQPCRTPFRHITVQQTRRFDLTTHRFCQRSHRYVTCGKNNRAVFPIQMAFIALHRWPVWRTDARSQCREHIACVPFARRLHRARAQNPLSAAYRRAWHVREHPLVLAGVREP